MAIYFLDTGLYFKIIYSRNPVERVKRIEKMQTINPTPLQVVAIIPGGKGVVNRIYASFEDEKFRDDLFLKSPNLETYIKILAKRHKDYAADIVKESKKDLNSYND